MKNVVALIFGISGVGKTTIINKYISKRIGVLCVSASGLLKEYYNINSSDGLRKLPSGNILENQYIICEQFSNYLQNQNGATVIFDGHNIIDNDSGIFVVPLDIAKKLSPDIIVTIYAPEEKILEQRIRDTLRVRPVRNLGQLKSQIDLSIKVSEEYAEALGIRHVRIRSDDFGSLSNELDILFKM